MTPATVAVRIPTALRRFSEGSARVTVETDDRGCTLAGLLHTLAGAHPGVVDRVLDEQGELRRHVNVFVGVEDVRHLGGLDAPVAAGSEVTIVPAVSGGAAGSSIDALTAVASDLRGIDDGCSGDGRTTVASSAPPPSGRPVGQLAARLSAEREVDSPTAARRTWQPASH
jgi:molybdopterin synthase sulfur carrier subunit